MVKPKKGLDAGDHPPITPVKAAMKGTLSDGEWKLYSFISRNFLACLCKDAVYDQIKVLVDIGGEQFKLKGSMIKELGFLEVMPWSQQSDKEIPKFVKGQSIFRKLYSFIARNFLACLCKDAVYDQIKVLVDIGGEQFKLKGSMIKELGFLEVMPWSQQSDKEIPKFVKDQSIFIKSLRVVEGKT
eukprot:CAMPEP_0202980298 /NCGR_PEP_ID=MMETSP1396-20130829/86252_1 /ASSEMBLY_ACC=CAM_ASM_000872 /TAXON_ID= /ORGANISM="Pseudokeronopsis sp., Strain Brazil" /LENGTH=184 /DNA_ID=CAMNT_0049720195 /DNA_START=935 /DNA_END=1489 /DNA_ORIENTATION=+